MQQSLKNLEKMIRRYEHFITHCSDETTIEQTKLLLDDCRTRYYSISSSMINRSVSEDIKSESTRSR